MKTPQTKQQASRKAKERQAEVKDTIAKQAKVGGYLKKLNATPPETFNVKRDKNDAYAKDLVNKGSISKKLGAKITVDYTDGAGMAKNSRSGKFKQVVKPSDKLTKKLTYNQQAAKVKTLENAALAHKHELQVRADAVKTAEGLIAEKDKVLDERNDNAIYITGAIEAISKDNQDLFDKIDQMNIWHNSLWIAFSVSTAALIVTNLYWGFA